MYRDFITHPPSGQALSDLANQAIELALAKSRRTTSINASILKGLRRNAERSDSYSFNADSATPLVIRMGKVAKAGIARITFAISIPSIIGIM